MPYSPTLGLPEALKDVADSWGWFTVVVIGVGAWFGKRLFAIAGRRTEGGIDRHWQKTSSWLKVRHTECRAARAQRSARKAEQERLSVLTKERVGARFLWRASPNDIGMIGEVVKLTKHGQADVAVVWRNPPGRATTEDDFTDGEVILMEWEQLVQPEAEQQHWTARLIAKSDNDADGWVRFERLIV